MSEVKRYIAGDIFDGAEVVYASDFDRVTAERDAALGREANLVSNAERGKRKYQKLLHRLQIAVGQRNSYKGHIIALQQRLTAADERVDELEGLLREVVALDPRGEFLGWQLDGKIDAALKPAEGGGDEA